VKAVDQWASAHSREDVFAQIGQTDYRPSSMRWTQFLDPVDFKSRYAAASAIVAHAGAGSIITALYLGKPIVIMPRRASMRETRNDHQVATAEKFRRFDSVVVAWDENELSARLDKIDSLGGSRAVGPYASRDLLDAIRGFIDHGVRVEPERTRIIKDR
jgi:UDP-N-acetylglucosamine transferase subunit ALG13